MLYRPELFEPLTDAAWDEHAVGRSVRGVVADVEAAYRGSRLWPPDPVPRTQRAADPAKSLYAGAAGTIWALKELQQRGIAETQLDLAAVAERALALFRDEPDFAETGTDGPFPAEASLLLGESGIQLLISRLSSPVDADALFAHVLANTTNPAEDLMWGTPGTLLAAVIMYEQTAEQRWCDVACESARALLARRDPEGLWTQRLYGQQARRLGPIHGATGNVHALRRLLGAEAREQLERETAALLARTAVVENGLANWPERAFSEKPSLLRWCAGAPGILVAAGDYLDDELVLAAAALISHAGAPKTPTGPSICCGTAGNGYALLKVFERTGDERWLGRARRFALHALEQVARSRAHGGGASGWYSLWQGDPGVALFAADCLAGTMNYPLLEFDPTGIENDRCRATGRRLG